MLKNLQIVSPIISPTNTNTIPKNASSVLRESNITIEVNSSSNISSKLRGQPAGTTVNDKKKNLKICKDVT